MADISTNRIMDIIKALAYARPSGSAAEERAFRLIQQELAKRGVSWNYDRFYATEMEYTAAYLEVDRKKYPVIPIVSPLYGSRRAIAKTEEITGTLVYAKGADTVFDPAGNWIALIPFPAMDQPCQQGAVAQVFLQPPSEEFIAHYLDCDDPIPAASLVDHVDLEQFSNCSAHLYWNSLDVDREYMNLSAEIRGAARPQEVVVVGAHLDTWPGSQGASNDAAGCALLLELAGWFMEHPPGRTLRFVWFTGEELDRRGSRAYAAANGGDNIYLYMNVDDGFSLDHANLELFYTSARHTDHELVEWLEGMGIPLHRRSIVEIDARSFEDYGIPTLYLTAAWKGPIERHHLSRDRLDRLDRQKIEQAGILLKQILDKATG